MELAVGKKNNYFDIRELNKKLKSMAMGPYEQLLIECLNDFNKIIDSIYCIHLKRLEATAYHEAGHTVAAYTLRRNFSYVTINPNNDSLGHVALEHKWFKHNLIDMAIWLAGFIAEYKAYGISGGFEYDFAHIDQIALSITKGVNGDTLFRRHLADFSLDLFESPGFWEAVEALAKALLEHKKLDSDAAKKIIKNAKRRARRINRNAGELH
jgi:hypothetical protein